MSNAKSFAGVMHNTTKSERDKKAEDLKQKKTLGALESTETNFPTFGAAVCKTTAAWNNKFSDLASDWKQTEEEKKDEEYRKEKRKQELAKQRAVLLPSFYNRRRFAEPGDEAQPEATAEAPSSTVDDDEWTTVVRKTRKPKPQVHYSEEEELSEEQPEEDTVWNNQEDVQYWDKHGH